uniref:DUF7021 domain-containing protein n=1 Tax=Escherichia sp. MOD1-EC7003 TaxID=2093900 RepID=UPI001F06E7B8|nr:hypothetical protein [Escherichia sp. MOD1-EC7003]
MDLNSEEYKKFSHTFKDTEEEILVLLSDTGGGAGKSGGDNYWTAQLVDNRRKYERSRMCVAV